MKKTLIFIISILMSNAIFAQTAESKHSVTLEVMPIAQLFASANGGQFSYNYDHKRFRHSFSLGFVFTNYETGTELHLFSSNGQPIDKWSTEVDFETTRPYPLGGVVNQIDFDNLDSWGIKQFKPKMGFRLNRYFTYEFLYKLINKKISLYAGTGVTLGLTNREESWVGFPDIITNEANGLTENIWVNINIRAKYLYLGWTGKMTIEYPVRENLSLGISGGFHFILNNFQYYIDNGYWSADETLYYIGILGRVNI